MFIAYRIISRLYFHLSVLYVIFAVHGQGPTAIGAILSAYGFAILLAGPVSAATIARLGPKRALITGEVAKGVGLVVVAVDPRLLAVALIGQVVNGIGFGVGQAADPLVLSAMCEGDSAAIGRVSASAQSKMFLATLVAGVTGALLFRVSSVLPLWTAAAASLVAAILALMLPEPGPAPASAAARAREAAPAAPPGPALVPAQRVAVGYYVMTRGFMLGAFVGLLPYLLYRLLAFSVVELSGALAAFSALAYLTARYSQAILARFGIATIMVATVALLTGSFLVFALWENAAASVVAMAIMGGASGAVRPVTLRSLSHIASDDPHAAPMGPVVARMERAFGLCNALVIFLGGLLIVHTSFRTGMVLLAAVYVAVQGSLAGLARRRVRSGAIPAVDVGLPS